MLLDFLKLSADHHKNLIFYAVIKATGNITGRKYVMSCGSCRMDGFYVICCEEIANLRKFCLEIYFVCELENSHHSSMAVAEWLGLAHRTTIFR